jgi:hypothetical protein
MGVLSGFWFYVRRGKDTFHARFVTALRYKGVKFLE